MRGSSCGSSSCRRLARLIACLLVATLGWTPGRVVAGAVENARAYLATSQLPSGLFRGASLADTAEALTALEDLSAKQAAQIATLIAVPGNNEDGVARLAILSQARAGDPVAAAALRASLASGELGLAPGSAAWDPMVLAWALRFAAGDAPSAGLVPLLALQIQARARPDGGHGFADNASDLALTAEMVRALRAGGPLSEPYAALSAQWVAAQISSANLASLSATDLALVILAAGETLPAERLIAAAAALALRQGPDGSFDGDVRATALAIQAQRVAGRA